MHKPFAATHCPHACFVACLDLPFQHVWPRTIPKRTCVEHSSGQRQRWHVWPVPAFGSPVLQKELSRLLCISPVGFKGNPSLLDTFCFIFFQGSKKQMEVLFGGRRRVSWPGAFLAFVGACFLSPDLRLSNTVWRFAQGQFRHAPERPQIYWQTLKWIPFPTRSRTNTAHTYQTIPFHSIQIHPCSLRFIPFHFITLHCVDCVATSDFYTRSHHTTTHHTT